MFVNFGWRKNSLNGNIFQNDNIFCGIIWDFAVQSKLNKDAMNLYEEMLL